AECAKLPAANRIAQQRRLNAFRAEYNHVRPHEALSQTEPARHYQRSPRPYPSRLCDLSYPTQYELRRVRSNGTIKWQGELVFISEALCGEVIGLFENYNGDAQAYFGPVALGTIDAIALKLLRPEAIPNGR